MKNNLLFFAMICATLFLHSCAKEGPQGPEGLKGDIGALGPKGDKGDKGDTGATGNTGATGPKGDKGDPGNANVKSYTKDITNATWTMEGTAASGLLKLEIPAPNVLTSSVVANAVILVYVQSSDFGFIWTLLPYYTERDIRVQYSVITGRLILKRDQGGRPTTQSNFSHVKLVVIESENSGPINRTAPVDYRDYEAVKAYYNLED